MHTALTILAAYLVIGLLFGELYDRGCKLDGKKPSALGWFVAFLAWPIGIYCLAKGR